MNRWDEFLTEELEVIEDHLWLAKHQPMGSILAGEITDALANRRRDSGLLPELKSSGPGDPSKDRKQPDKSPGLSKSQGVS